MKNIEEAVLSYLKMKTHGALLISGEWGSGKTYFIKNNLFPLIEEQIDYKTIVVSLYGETDKNNVGQKVLFAYLDKYGKKAKLSTGAIAKGLKNITEAIPKIGEYVDVGKLFAGTGETVFRFLPKEKLLICFDDLERMSDEIDVNDFLGIVNDLVENKGSKVILIANEGKLKHGIEFKEKTIERTLGFFPNMPVIFDHIVNTYDKDFKAYLQGHKDVLLNSLNAKLGDGVSQELSKAFSNIRTLKFAVEHFNSVFEIINQSKIKNEVKLAVFENVWLFILAISVEFKKPDVSILNKEELVQGESLIADYNMPLAELFSSTSDAIEDQPKEQKFLKYFIDTYFKRLGAKYIYYPDIYDFITSGQPINKSELLQLIDKKFNIEGQKVNPAHEILDKLTKSFWQFSNDEFVAQSITLLAFIEQGRIMDILSYVNASVYLFAYKDILGQSSEVIKEKTTKGLDILFAKIELNPLILGQLEMMEGFYSDKDVLSVIDHIKEKVKAKKDEESKIEISNLQQLLISDPAKFSAEQMRNESGIKVADKPFFHLLDFNAFGPTVKSWGPNAVINFSEMLKHRYHSTAFPERLVPELAFLEQLHNELEKIDRAKLLLSTRLIDQFLLPNLEKSIDRLKPFEKLVN